MSAGKNLREKMEVWLTLAAVAGMAVFIGGSSYDIYSLRTGPRTPDAIHWAAVNSHGSNIYMTPAHAKYRLIVPFSGLAIAMASGIGANVLGRGEKRRGTISRR